MQIDQTFDYPPYLLQVLKNCPKAGLTYCELWQRRNSESKIYLLKKEIKTEFLIHRAKFENDILLLVKEGLINMHETSSAYCIELVNFISNEDE